ncbi:MULTISPECIES: DUF1684 domain-containing protein [Streptomyces]|uniref:DUF1684 domain-containing protein n=1 Tax=Streptomyces TaxID=1883 RepID=UPI002248C925|nr:DUF1684 domain-containing protein [Streptomyces sp. JHD 1]MCX2970420.1 DUF1684 domain-containing protein [Streptomyces sp. JHD 1]
MNADTSPNLPDPASAGGPLGAATPLHAASPAHAVDAANPVAPGSSAAQRWQEWHQQRLETVLAPYGPLSVTGTHWLADADDQGRVEGLPGQWHPTPDGTGVVVHADVLDELSAGGEMLVGERRLGGAPGAVQHTRITWGDRRLELLRREGRWAVRVHDPAAPARRAFPGIRTTPYDERWVLPGTFHAYEGARRVPVPNADGHTRGLELGGEVRFTAPDGGEHDLRVSVVGSGALWAVFADATSGHGSHRFRFLRTGAPASDGTVTVDFNRTTLPPCAFADHFLCPFPPPGNTLELAVRAGERDLSTG